MQVEPHYGTEYHVDRITEETLSEWRGAGHNPAFSLPQPNPLICSAPSHTLSHTPCPTPTGPIQLWQFILEQLSDKTCQHFISWTGDGWEFKMTDPDEVSPEMTFSKQNNKKITK